MTNATVIAAPDYKDPRHAYQRPRDAATLILIDRSKRKPKVLMGRRHAGHKFMPGVFVFPGGRVDPADREMVAAGMLDPVVETRLMARTQRPTLQRARAMALAAVRETYEETGLMLGSRDYGAPEAPADGPWAAFAEHGVFPVLETLHYVARAITPPGRSRRFDTRFFAADVEDVAHRTDPNIGPDSELVELVWVDLDKAASLEAPWITHVILADVKARIDAGFSPFLPVPFYHELHGKRLREEIA
ncbi:NUDIX hydrolase [uncultured Alsobacter sp.]|uniref:NUDIX hydrolase n=1 Tax=uncultured Alsobacter sp. TaxID=1748258 RepID=UPI0025D156AC|nr:NUDIX hydrolase [uncultured Alsobacter sp.]